VCGEFGFGAGQRPVEHGDLRIFSEDGAQADPLVERGDEERTAAGGGERGSDRRDTEPISIRLDYGGAFRRRDACGQQAPIGGDRAQVDVEHGAGAIGGIGNHRQEVYPASSVPVISA
jgi:hypothetical protein